MERLEALPSRGSLLQRIIPAVILIGVLTALVFVSTGSNRSLFLQIGAGIALLVYILTFVDIILGLSILIACIGMSPEISMAGMNDLRLEDFVIPALIMAWLARSGEMRQPFAPAFIKGPALAYFLSITVSTILGISAGTTFLPTPLLILAKYVEYYLLYLIIINNVRTKDEFKAVVLFSILTAIASSLILSVPAIDSTGQQRVHGPLGETANIYGGYLILNMSILIGLYLHTQTFGSRLLATGALLPLGASLMYTYSRTSFTALMAGMFLFGLLKDRRLLLVLVILTLLFPIVAPQSVASRVATIGGVALGPEPPSWGARVEAWNDAIAKVFRTNPVLGLGLGSVRLGDVDSEYARALVDSGLIGLALFGWLLAKIGRTANQVYDSIPPSTFQKGYAAGYMIAFFAFVVHAIAATSFTAIRTMECFMLFTGLFTCLANHLEAWERVPSVPAAAGKPALGPLIAPPYPR